MGKWNSHCFRPPRDPRQENLHPALTVLLRGPRLGSAHVSPGPGEGGRRTGAICGSPTSSSCLLYPVWCDLDPGSRGGTLPLRFAPCRYEPVAVVPCGHRAASPGGRRGRNPFTEHYKLHRQPGGACQPKKRYGEEQSRAVKPPVNTHPRPGSAPPR